MRIGRSEALFCAIGFVIGTLWIFVFQVNKTTTAQELEEKADTFIPELQLNFSNYSNSGDILKTSFTIYTGLAQHVHAEFYPDDPTVCIVIRTYTQHRSRLPALIASLASNEYANMHIYLVDTEGDFHDLHKFERLFNSLYSQEFVHSTNITKQYARERFPLFNAQDYGYLQTDLLIEQLSQPDHPHHCDYFLVTNGDNLYGGDLMKLTVSYLRAEWGLVGFHFLTHYCTEQPTYWVPREGCYTQHYTEFKLRMIDLGAAFFSKKRMLELNHNFILNELKKDPTGYNLVQTDYIYFLDGIFFELFADKEYKKVILNATLFLHQ